MRPLPQEQEQEQEEKTESIKKRRRVKDDTMEIDAPKINPVARPEFIYPALQIGDKDPVWRRGEIIAKIFSPTKYVLFPFSRQVSTPSKDHQD